MMNIEEKDVLDICYEKECENYGTCALDTLLPKEIHDMIRPKCHYYYIKQKGIKFRGEDGHELSDEEVWDMLSYPAVAAKDKK